MPKQEQVPISDNKLERKSKPKDFTTLYNQRSAEVEAALSRSDATKEELAALKLDLAEVARSLGKRKLKEPQQKRVMELNAKIDKHLKQLPRAKAEKGESVWQRAGRRVREIFTRRQQGKEQAKQEADKLKSEAVSKQLGVEELTSKQKEVLQGGRTRVEKEIAAIDEDASVSGLAIEGVGAATTEEMRRKEEESAQIEAAADGTQPEIPPEPKPGANPEDSGKPKWLEYVKEQRSKLDFIAESFHGDIFSLDSAELKLLGSSLTRAGDEVRGKHVHVVELLKSDLIEADKRELTEFLDELDELSKFLGDRLQEVEQHFEDISTSVPIHEAEPVQESETDEFAAAAALFRAQSAVELSAEPTVETVVPASEPEQKESPVKLGPAYWVTKDMEVPVTINEDLGEDKPGGQRRVRVEYKNVVFDPKDGPISGGRIISFDYIRYEPSVPPQPVTPEQPSAAAVEAGPRVETRPGKEKWYKTAAKVVGQMAYRTVTTIFGIKTITDLGLAVAKKGDIYEYAKGKKGVKTERVTLQNAVDNFFKEYKSVEGGSSDRFSTTVSELDEKIKTAEYLSPDERKAFRSQLARTIWEYRKKEQTLDAERSAKVTQAANLYFKNKISGFRLGADALNTASTLAGLPMLRGAGYGLMALLERGSKADTAFAKDKLWRESKAVTIGTKADKKAVVDTGRKLGPQNYYAFIAKDLLVNSSVETARGLVGRGKTADSQHKVRDFVESLGTVTRAFGLAGISLSEIHVHGVSGSIQHTIDGFHKSIEANGTLGGVFSELGHNFGANAERMLYMYTHPGETLQQSWSGAKRMVGLGHGAPFETPASKSGFTLEQRHQLELSELKRGGDILEQDAKRLGQPLDKLGIKTAGLNLNEMGELHGKLVQLEQAGLAQAKPELAAALLKANGGDVTKTLANLEQVVGGKVTAENLHSSHLDDPNSKEFKQVFEVTPAGVAKASGAGAVIEAAVGKAGAAELPPGTEKIWTPEHIKVGEGGSYWSTFLKQYHTNPEYFGYNKQSGLTSAEYGNRLMAEYTNEHDLVSVTKQGQEVEVRLKNPAATLQWQMKAGKLELVEGQGAKAPETYKFAAHLEPTKSAPSIEQPAPKAEITQAAVKGAGTGTALEWREAEVLKGGGGIREAVVETNALGRHDWQIAARDVDIQGRGFDGRPNVVMLYDEDGDYLNHYYPDAKVDYDSAALATDAHRHFEVVGKHMTEVEQTLATNVPDLSSHSRAELASWAIEHGAVDKVQALVPEKVEAVTALAKVVGGHSEYLQDAEFKAWLKTSLVNSDFDRLQADRLSATYDFVQDLKQQGFKQIDIGVADHLQLRGGVVQDGQLVSNLKSPLSGGALATPLSLEVLNAEAVRGGMNRMVGWYREELTAWNNIKDTVGETDAKEIISWDCNQANDVNIEKQTSGFLGLSKGGGPELYEYLKRMLGPDFTTKPGTVGEQLSEAIRLRGTTSGAEGVSGPDAATEEVVKQTDVQPAVESEAEVKKEIIVEQSVAEEVKGQKAGAPPEELPKKTGVVAGAAGETETLTRQQAGEAMASLDKGAEATDLLRNPKVTAEAKFAALDALHLKNNESVELGTFKISRLNGNYYYADQGGVHTLTKDNIGQLAGIYQQAHAELMKQGAAINAEPPLEAAAAESGQRRFDATINDEHVKGKVNIELSKQGGETILHFSHDVNVTGIGGAVLIKDKIVTDGYESMAKDYVRAHSENATVAYKVIDKLNEEGSMMYVHLKTHEALVQAGKVQEAGAYADVIRDELGKLEKTYGPDVFDREAIEAKLTGNAVEDDARNQQ